MGEADGWGAGEGEPASHSCGSRPPTPGGCEAMKRPRLSSRNGDGEGKSSTRNDNPTGGPVPSPSRAPFPCSASSALLVGRGRPESDAPAAGRGGVAGMVDSYSKMELQDHENGRTLTGRGGKWP